ncbi:MAG: carbamoyltransferase HypF [Desulfobulbaceae bacterium]|nr:carbamoyltransferase HypF [Desulfobulbaceae bacterium]
MPEKKLVARRLNVNGIVQGVGFRPFVCRLAACHRIAGDVANTSSGVSIHIEGAYENIEAFCLDISKDPPPLANIIEVSIHPEPVQGCTDFSIVKSRSGINSSTLISPDVSICKDCLFELFDPENRRYQYPFINCTNCGPRYTIIEKIPYDRPYTSMKSFVMCKRCQAEYDDVMDRRFHAQPNACHKCGPEVRLYDASGSKMDVEDPVKMSAMLLKQGKIVAIKGLGGFHLAVDAENSDAVRTLRKRKQREEKPFAVMSFDLERIRGYARVESVDEAFLTSPQRPIVILRKKESNSLAAQVAPQNSCFGVMLPYTPLHYLLLNNGFTALVMTSGNLSDEPICINNEEAFDRLSGVADYFLIHNREIYLRSDDSIVTSLAGTPSFIRRSRGYVPAPLFLKQSTPRILACGAELKNTVCFAVKGRAFLSQHIGDLENLETFEFFKMTIEHMKGVLDLNPEIIAHDLHPDYMSTRFALEQDGMTRVGVQHHHAHVVSCMAENRLDGPVIGLAFDGTGFGNDGKIWGGEILICEYSKFVRAGHISYVPMPGSAAAIKEPWRMAVSYLYDAFGRDFYHLDLPFLKGLDRNRVKIVIDMIDKGVNSPATSSLGRLFDGIAAIVGIRNKVGFEGQAAMELEMLIKGPEQLRRSAKTYDYEWIYRDIHTIPPEPIVRGVVKDVEHSVDPVEISLKFHLTIIRLFSELCDTIRKEQGLCRVVLSGGVFQNSILLSGLKQELIEKKFKVFTHSMVPPNDGGISLGQAVVAAAIAA